MRFGARWWCRRSAAAPHSCPGNSQHRRGGWRGGKGSLRHSGPTSRPAHPSGFALALAGGRRRERAACAAGALPNFLLFTLCELSRPKPHSGEESRSDRTRPGEAGGAPRPYPTRLPSSPKSLGSSSLALDNPGGGSTRPNSCR